MPNQTDLNNLNTTAIELKVRSAALLGRHPQAITRARLSVDLVDNTPDMEKPVSVPQKTYIDGKYVDATTYIDNAVNLLNTAISNNSVADQAFALAQIQAAINGLSGTTDAALQAAIATLQAAIAANAVADQAFATDAANTAKSQALSTSAAALQSAVDTFTAALAANSVADRAYSDGIVATATLTAASDATSKANAALAAAQAGIDALSVTSASTYATITQLNTLTSTVSENDTAIRAKLASDLTTAISDIHAYIDGMALGTLSLRGVYNPMSTSLASLVSSAVGRGVDGALSKGDIFVLQLDTGVNSHTFTGVGLVTPGDYLVAMVDGATNPSDFALIETPNTFASLPADMVVASINGYETDVNRVASIAAMVAYCTETFTPITWSNEMASVVANILLAVQDQNTSIAELQAAMLA
jgi:hypothetical protein